MLFFVSVGMLVDPRVDHRATQGRSCWSRQSSSASSGWPTYGIVELLGYPQRIGLTVAAASSQVGEFSFILITLGVTLGLVPDDALQVVVAAALVSITLNPFCSGRWSR